MQRRLLPENPLWSGDEGQRPRGDIRHLCSREGSDCPGWTKPPDRSAAFPLWSRLRLAGHGTVGNIRSADSARPIYCSRWAEPGFHCAQRFVDQIEPGQWDFNRLKQAKNLIGQPWMQLP